MPRDSDNMFPIDRAREIRRAKAIALEQLESGSLDLVVALRKSPRALRGTAIYDILVATQGLGPIGAKITLEGAALWPMLCLGEITPAQRDRIIENLPPRYKEN